ncbi:hypothetical protein ABZ078_16770 [Streptomyces sp. NPDC006385]|uniref:hypothetical protein n=1 Tax=Streptomyces sp. NPDC006385 TaxID=3156761 RepID=UPI0033A5D08B
MTEALPLHGELFVDDEVTADDRQLLSDAVGGLGVTVRPKPTPALRGADTVTWVVLALLPLQAVLTSLGTKAGEDAWARLRKTVASIAARRGTTAQEPGPPTGTSATPLVLQDTTTGIRILMEPDLPDGAYAALRELDLSRFQYGPLHYDREAQRWRSIADEVAEYGL